MMDNLADELAQTQFRVHDPEAIIEHHHGYEMRIGRDTVQLWQPAEGGGFELMAEFHSEEGPEQRKAMAIRAADALANFHGTLE